MNSNTIIIHKKKIFVKHFKKEIFMEKKEIERTTIDQITALEAKIKALREQAKKEGLELSQNFCDEEIKIIQKTEHAKIDSLDKVNKHAKASSEGLSKEWKKAFEEARKAATEFAQGSNADINSVSESLLNAVFGGGVKGDIASIIGGPIIEGLLKGLLGGGKFADGGRPPVGRASLVGERGPELFVPDSAGTVIPNDTLNSAQCVVYQNFTFQSLDPVVNMKLLEAQKSQIRDWVVDGIKTNKSGLRSTISSIR